MTYKRYISIMMVILSLLLSGCWDKIEIDNRAFVLGMVIDSVGVEKGKTEEGGGDKAIKVSFYMPIPSKLLSGGVDAFSVEDSKGKDIPDAIEKLSMEFSRQIFLGDVKIIILSENLLKDSTNLEKVMDFLERDPDIGRGGRVLVLKGDTKSLTKVKPKFENVFASDVGGVIENSKAMFSEMSLSMNDFLSRLRENKGSVTLPVAEVNGENIEVNGLALLKDYKLSEYMNSKYILPYSIITNTLKDGTYNIKFKDNNLSLKISSCSTKIHLDKKGDKLKYMIEPRIEMDVDNYIIGKDLFRDKEISDIKEKLSISIKEELTKTIEYFQNTIGFDYLKIDEFTKKYHYSLYKRYEKDWNEKFKKATFEYNVKVFLRRIGGTRK